MISPGGRSHDVLGKAPLPLAPAIAIVGGLLPLVSQDFDRVG